MWRSVNSPRAAFMAGAIAIGASLSGCASFRGAPAWDGAQKLDAVDALYAGYVAQYFNAVSPDVKASIRNQYVTVRMAIVDGNYQDYKQGLYSQRVGSAVALDTLTMTLNAAGAAIADVGTKTATSAVSAGLVGGQASIDKNVYFDRTLPAMLSQMDGLRSQIRARLYAGLILSSDSYPISEAHSDLTAYFDAGTIYGAISALTNQAGQTQASADKVLKDRHPSEPEIKAQLASKGFAVTEAAVTETTAQVQKCLDANGKLSPPVQTAFDTFFATAQPAWVSGLPAGTLPASVTPRNDFFTHGAYEPLRRQALADPTLGPLLKACK